MSALAGAGQRWGGRGLSRGGPHRPSRSPPLLCLLSSPSWCLSTPLLSSVSQELLASTPNCWLLPSFPLLPYRPVGDPQRHSPRPSDWLMLTDSPQSPVTGVGRREFPPSLPQVPCKGRAEQGQADLPSKGVPRTCPPTPRPPTGSRGACCVPTAGPGDGARARQRPPGLPVHSGASAASGSAHSFGVSQRRAAIPA